MGWGERGYRYLQGWKEGVEESNHNGREDKKKRWS